MSLRTEFPNYRLKKVPGQFGLEIETEVLSSDQYPSNFFVEKARDHAGNPVYQLTGLPEFEGHIDNSLRNFGMEFVFTKPLNLKAAEDALDNFAKVTAKVPFLADAPATSVHVHMNCLEEEMLTIGNFLTLYTYFENVLVEFSGPTRRSNLFALPIRVAEYTMHNMVRLFQMTEDATPTALNFPPQNVKYAGINLACLSKLGTLEVRTMRGTTDIKLIKTWLRLFHNMWEYARIPGLTPKRILTQIRDRSDELFSEVFGTEASDLKRTVEASGPAFTIEALTSRNLDYVVQLATAIKDWGSINTAVSRFREKEKLARAGTIIPSGGMVNTNIEGVVDAFVAATGSHATWGATLTNIQDELSLGDL